MRLKSFVSLALIAAGALAMSACSTVTTTKVLDNLAGCERHYDGAIGASMAGGQFSGTVKIDCTPAAVAAATAK
jgi:hypothetical protein